ncbi:coiled-coil domain-containing protein [Pseudomonas syringae]|uniref:AAA family ATPase n=1 Tax=Pseudomonas syringae TaxID=317 RepID=UPI000420C879|nr:AAA family ATPase [Pseudomonas syringae]UOF19750.1 AAA family ATPase [Pseudomonas syringae CC440]UZA82165.1 exonuclease SbcC [Pseudomonas syringae]
MKSFININRLILVGHRKNYTTTFFPGVNIIYGDSDTGKSSILEFVNYLLGSSEIELADEVSSSVRYAVLDITINGSSFTVKRDIFKPKDRVEVYPCIFEECSSCYPKKFASSYSDTNAPDGFYSDFLLDTLNFPKVKIKVSPSQAVSELKRLSFRSLFKFAYLNQDEVGGKSFLDLGNWVQATSNREVFKYIFNVLDSSITELQAEISEKYKESNRIKNKYDAVSEFLRETDHESPESLDAEIDQIDSQLELLVAELSAINKSMVSDSDTYRELKAYLSELALLEKSATLKIKSTSDQVDQYIRLRNDYENDIQKINGIKTSSSRLGEVSTTQAPCPVCDNVVSIEDQASSYQLNSDAMLNDELKSLSKRKNNLNVLISDLQERQRTLLKDQAIFKSDILKARDLIDTEAREMITPFLTQRDTFVQEIAKHQQIRKKLADDLKIRNQQEKIYRSYELLKASITSLEEQLEKLKQNAPDLDGILSVLGDHLNAYLKSVKIKNRTNIAIRKSTLAPVIRDRDYYKITSGGLRTITSIGYMLSLLEYSIDHDINHPRFLMLDTVGKYLGKTTKAKYVEETVASEDSQEGISDPEKYQNIYESILATANRADELGVPCQVILVDNDVPDSFVSRFRAYIVANFSSTQNNGLPSGLIDDLGR